MQGKRIKQVNQAILDIKDYLKELQVENTNVDFFITIIPFATEASFYKDTKYINIDNFDYEGIKIGGYSNLHLGYELLGDILKKESKGGIMPDFGGVAPIILLLTDGHPTGKMYKEYLERISTSPWFKAALRYGIAIELDDEKTLKVLNDFVGGNGDGHPALRCNLFPESRHWPGRRRRTGLAMHFRPSPPASWPYGGWPSWDPSDPPRPKQSPIRHY